uniref:Uncharacterized protein n=1 Tax=Dromaius novaehollandiae TaxID=8790 RepID=A0A8C4K191_DRONO
VKTISFFPRLFIPSLAFIFGPARKTRLHIKGTASSCEPQAAPALCSPGRRQGRSPRAGRALGKSLARWAQHCFPQRKGQGSLGGTQHWSDGTRLDGRGVFCLRAQHWQVPAAVSKTPAHLHQPMDVPPTTGWVHLHSSRGTRHPLSWPKGDVWLAGTACLAWLSLLRCCY